MARESSGRFDISDPLGVRLALLGRMCAAGNGYAAWVAYRLCRAEGRALPDWLLTYFDETAVFLLDSYHRDDKRDRQIEFGLGLGSPKTRRGDAARVKPSGEQMQMIADALLPGIVDDYAKEHGVKPTTAIKALAPVLGFPGEQWTRLRDAYNRARAGSAGRPSPRPYDGGADA